MREPGLLSMILFVVLAVRRLWGFAKKLALLDSFCSRYALFFCVSLMVLFFKYFFIMGSITELGQIIGAVAVAYVLSDSVLQISAHDESPCGSAMFGSKRS
jgi:hypothetical protein